MRPVLSLIPRERPATFDCTSDSRRHPAERYLVLAVGRRGAGEDGGGAARTAGPAAATRTLTVSAVDDAGNPSVAGVVRLR